MTVPVVESVEPDPLQAIYNDPTFSAFLKADFDPDEHANQIIQGLTLSASLSKLSHGLEILDKQIHSQVVSHHTDLLQQATGIQKVERVLDVIKSRVHSLKHSLDRIRLKINGPYEEISSLTLQLSRIQNTCMYLRKVIRFIYLTKRLKTQLRTGSRDVSKAAASVNEIESVCSGIDLSGIHVVDNGMDFIHSSKVELLKEGDNLLRSGISNLKQSEISTALQVFHNLQCLSDKSSLAINEIIRDLFAQIKDCLNVNSLTKQIQHEQQAEKLQNVRNKIPSAGMSGKSSGSGVGSGSSGGNSNALLRAALWGRLEKFFSEMGISFMKIYHLSQVLSKKKDVIAQESFMFILMNSSAFQETVMRRLNPSSERGDTFSYALLEDHGVNDLEGDVALAVHLRSGSLTHSNTLLLFWHVMTSHLSIEFSNACKHSNFLRTTFEGEYPKLLSLVRRVWNSVDEQIGGKFTDGARRNVSLFEYPVNATFLNLKVHKIDVSNILCSRMLVNSVHKFETQYLARSLGRIYDPINSIFPSGSKNPPKVDDVGPVLDAIRYEIEVARVDESLLIKMCKNAAKAIKMFTVKSENIVSTEADAYYVSGPATITLKRNILLINCLYQLQMAIKHLCASQTQSSLESLPEAAVEYLIDSADKINELIESILAPLFEAIQHRLEEVLYGMLDADFSDNAPTSRSIFEIAGGPENRNAPCILVNCQDPL